MPVPPALAHLVAELNSAVQSYDDKNSSDTEYLSPYTPEARNLSKVAEQLSGILKPVEERLWMFIYSPSALACANIAFDCGLLAPWPRLSMSSNELAVFTSADTKLITRVMRGLVLYKVFDEIDEEVYAHTTLSQVLSSSPLTPFYKTMSANQIAGVVKIPEYIKSISYRNPGDDSSDKTYFQYANNTDLSFFQSMQNTPKQIAYFQKTMAAGLAVERQWHKDGFASIFPFAELSKGATTDDVVLVEVGGGHGHVVKELRTTLPEFVGRMVVEDLPAVVNGAPAQNEVAYVPYNFLTEKQPIEAARAYLFRHVLLDWSDSDCRTILLNTIPALKKGHSRILIAESILPKMDPTPYKAMIDVNMIRFEGRGRKERQWLSLFQSVGLDVVKIWPDNGYDSIMELQLEEG